MNAPTPQMLQWLADPIGLGRVVQRLMTLATITQIHLRRIPDDAQQTELNARAHDWAKLLLKGMGIRNQLAQPAPHEGALLVSNHRSYVDILVLLAATPCCFLAKGDVVNWPIMGTAAKRVGTVFVDRNATDSRKASRDAIARLLTAGHTIVVFPEGTTHGPPGCADFRRGAFEVAHDVGAPVLPAAIEYGRAQDAWTGQSFLEHFIEFFRQPDPSVELQFGALLKDAAPAQLMFDAHQWIDQTLR